MCDVINVIINVDDIVVVWFFINRYFQEVKLMLKSVQGYKFIWLCNKIFCNL